MQWRLLIVVITAAAGLLPAAALDKPTPAETLLDQARAAPIEIFADVAFRLMRANVLPPARQVEVMEEVFRRAGEARQALPMKRSKPGPAGTGPSEFVGRANDLHLDALSLRSRAVQLLVVRDPRSARRLFEEIPLREWQTIGCEAAFVPDPLLYYKAFAEVLGKGAFTARENEKREPLLLAERVLRSMTTIEELVAVAPFLQKVGEATGGLDRINMAYRGAAAAVKEAMAQKPKCTDAAQPKAWSNEADFKALLKEISRLPMKDREKPDWAFRALQLMRKVEDWRDVPGISFLDAFHQRVELWHAVEDRCPPGELHRKALEGFLSTLNEPAVIRDAPAEWLLHVNYPVFRASIFTREILDHSAKGGHPFDEDYINLPEQLMQASPNLVIAIYGQLAAMRIMAEWQAPRE